MQAKQFVQKFLKQKFKQRQRARCRNLWNYVLGLSGGLEARTAQKPFYVPNSHLPAEFAIACFLPPRFLWLEAIAPGTFEEQSQWKPSSRKTVLGGRVRGPHLFFRMIFLKNVKVWFSVWFRPSK